MSSTNLRGSFMTSVLVSLVVAACGCGGAESPPARPDGGCDPSAHDGGPDVSPIPADPNAFVFSTTPADALVQRDRIGFPGANLLFNLSVGSRDRHNQRTPVHDANVLALMSYASDIVNALNTWVLGPPGAQVEDNTGVADDLMAEGLMPCDPPQLTPNNCDDQIIPAIVPDVLTIRADQATDFVGTGELNGRRLHLPVVDFILARIWLDLSHEPVSKLYDFDEDGTPGPSLNPRTNDVAFLTEFPYLAPAH